MAESNWLKQRSLLAFMAAPIISKSPDSYFRDKVHFVRRFKGGLTKIHFFWTLYWLKVYPSECVAATHFRTSETNFHTKVDRGIDALNMLDEIHFEDRFENWDSVRPSCYVDGTDVMVTEVRPLNKKDFSNKFHRAGFRYQANR
ncbi:hypothetical protein HDU98_002228 [Podochytrium sp. JEL0797]|nr:hypothetical protein HDU98_002228 [Podochytrium sp. JEL0797]